MKNRVLNKGFTLVEVIIGLALLGIISVIFLNMFTIATSIYKKSSEMDYVTTKSPLVFSGESVLDIKTTTKSDSFVITFGEDQISANGSFITGEKEEGSGETIKVFKPNP